MESCGNCYHGLYDSANTLRCHRYPPIPNYRLMMLNSGTLHVPVFSNDLCGEWKARNK